MNVEFSRQSNALHNLRLIVDTIPALAWSARPDGLADFFNQHYQDFVGRTSEELQGAGWTAVIHPDDLPGLVTIWQGMMASGRGGEAEARVRRSDGEYRWLLFRANPLRDESGAIVKWYGVNTDIDDRRRVEEALSISERNLKLTIETMPTMVWSANSSGGMLTLNQHYLDFLGVTSEQAVELGWTAFVHPEDLPAAIEAQRTMLATGTGGETEARIRRHDGEYRWLMFRTSPLRDENGHVVKWYGVITDIEDRKRAEEALNRVRSELARVARVTALSTLTASIAHEVNQPLAGIITNANTCLRMLALDPPDVDGARETAKRTIRDGNRASEVIKRLRGMFGNKPFAAEEVDLNEAAREVISLSSSELQRNHISIRTDFGNDVTPVTGDRVQLQQVILNLLLNAADAMREVAGRQRQIVVKTDIDDEGDARLSVRDTGTGLPPEAVQRIFEPFYTTKPDGMGIGLSVSRSIIERHLGRMAATTHDGPGVTVSFSLPRQSVRLNPRGSQ